MAFTPSQVQVARALSRAPLYATAGPKVRKAELEAGIVESSLSNPGGGDRDSIGTLQQRPSQGWGSPEQLRNITYQSTQFLKRAIPIAGKYGSAGQLAQAVQRSAFPERYDDHAAEAAQLLAQLGGGGGGARALGSMGAGAPAPPQQPDVAALLAQLEAPQQQAGSPLADTPLARPATAGGPEAPVGPRVPSGLTPPAAKPPDVSALVRALSAGSEEQEAPAGTEGHASAGEVAAGSGHYVNPLPGFTKGRTDQGVDYSAKAGAPIRAIGNAKVLGITPDWYEGQPYVYYRLEDGPQKGKVVYVAEQIAPSVRPGQRVRAGQTIGRYAPKGTGIETGYSNAAGTTQAKATTGYTEGQETAAGKQARQFLERLGAR